ncbi:hypothetical protein FS837_012981, partial [Tulasnella sp. UAMH 9824]
MGPHDGSRLINRGSSPEPPVTLGQLPQQPPKEEELAKTIDTLRNTVVKTIKATEWPEDSKEAVKGLIDTVESSPDIPTMTHRIPQDIGVLIDQYIQVLEDVHARLKDASSKKGIKTWKIYRTLRSMASNRPSRCTLLFQTCQHDLSEVVDRLQERMDSERSKGAAEVPPEEQLTVPSAQQLGPPLSNAQSDPSGHAPVPPSPTPPARNSPSPGPEDEESASPIRGEALNIARKTLKAVEMTSGSIPVAGSYVATAAKIGLA